MNCYVLEIVGGCAIVAHRVDEGNGDQTLFAKKLAKENGVAAMLSGEVQYFWADIVDGYLEVGAFDEDLLGEEDE